MCRTTPWVAPSLAPWPSTYSLWWKDRLSWRDRKDQMWTLQKTRLEYTYRCSRCDFNLHARCASLSPTMESEVHHHPLTPFLKWITFTCDLCGKEGKGAPNLCGPCIFWIHGRCASLPRRLKVLRHKHPLHLTHSFLEVGLHQSDSRFCQLCVQKVNTNYGFYYCSTCNFIAHHDCAADYRYRENINLLELKRGWEWRSRAWSIYWLSSLQSQLYQS